MFNRAQCPTKELTTLHFYTDKVQLLQAFEPNDKPKYREFAVNRLERIFEYKIFLKHVCFSDEAIFHIQVY